MPEAIRSEKTRPSFLSRVTAIAAFGLFLAGSAIAETPSEAADTAMDTEATAVIESFVNPEPAPELSEEAEAASTPAADLCTGSDSKALESMQFMGFFGSHCTNRHTCSYTEPGLGFNCSCHYSCDCATCNGTFVRINCVLVENDGCFACPTYNN